MVDRERFRILPEEEARRRWDAWLTGIGGANPRQSSAWGRYKKGSWQPLYAAFSGAGAVPSALALCLLRNLPVGRGTLAWINAGPVYDPARPADLLRLLEGLREHLRAKGPLILRISPYAPYEQSTAGLLRAHGFHPASRRIDSGKTFVVDLSPDPESLRRGLEKKWRNQLKASEKTSFGFSEGRSEDLLRRYHALHEETCRRKNLRGQRLELADLFAMGSRLRERISFLLASSQERDACGLAVLTFGDRAVLWHSAAADWALPLNAPNALYWRALLRLREQGIRSFDLGGYDREKNWGVFNFKRGLGGNPLDLLGEWDWSDSQLLRRSFNWALRLKGGL